MFIHVFCFTIRSAPFPPFFKDSFLNGLIIVFNATYTVVVVSHNEFKRNVLLRNGVQQPNVHLLHLCPCLLEPKCACSCFQSTIDIKRLVNLSSSSSSAGPGPGHGQPQLPGQGLPEKNGFAGHIHHLPDLIQQSHHPPSSSSTTIPSSPSASYSFPSSSSHASPAISPQNPLDKFTAIEVCCPHATQANKEWTVGVYRLKYAEQIVVSLIPIGD